MLTTDRTWEPSPRPGASGSGTVATVHATQPPPSSWHRKPVAAGSVATKAKSGSRTLLEAAGPSTNWAGAGAVRSTSQVSVVASPALPAPSTARRCSTWVPSARPDQCRGVGHGDQVAVSSRHCNASDGSATSSTTSAVVWLVGSAGPVSTTGAAGAVRSTSQVQFTGELALPTASTLTTDRTWEPS